MESILEIVNLRKTFGGLTAVNNVSFNVQQGQIKALIGPNGAGKTTIYNLIAGTYVCTGGEIKFKNKLINKYKPHIIASLGIVRTFQNVQLFGNMTVLENVMVGCHTKTKSGIFSAALSLPHMRTEERNIRESSMEKLKFVDLDSRASELASNLSFGEQRLLEIARALAVEPELLLLDEPAAGLNTRETEKLAQTIYKIRNLGVTILIVEHDMNLVMEISDQVIVLNYGIKIAEGKPNEIQNNEEVIAAYLGE